MTEIKASERLRELAEFIHLKVTDEQFSMSDFVGYDQMPGTEDLDNYSWPDLFQELKNHRCGTWGCIGGWAAVCFNVPEAVRTNGADTNKLCEVLGLTHAEGEQLFYYWDDETSTRSGAVWRLLNWAREMEIDGR